MEGEGELLILHTILGWVEREPQMLSAILGWENHRSIILALGRAKPLMQYTSTKMGEPPVQNTSTRIGTNAIY